MRDDGEEEEGREDGELKEEFFGKLPTLSCDRDPRRSLVERFEVILGLFSA